ncbi:redoxin domain-containing protein [Halobacillus mangrovi]|uniref:Alkyl hydroperoxide reductase n=1 Tax=Halobacillus mangrovi TaxID=402384 RepID=A0A1W5ZR95_9BACI|nr:redoxin domain-containing protein [Halobacillus mangrovi]ARI75777.1 alkyl hydroperoxide reductase [Halobacillus mangrovi]
MKKWIIILGITALFGWAVYDFTDKETKENPSPKEESSGTKMVAEGEAQSTPQTGLKKGQNAPDFTLTRLNGETAKLSDYRGQKVLINFWATWCPPCRAEMPDMEKLYNETDIEILAVNLTGTESARGDVNNFVQELELTFPILLDHEAEVMGKYQVGPVPTSIFVDEDGKVQSFVLGAMNYDMMMQRYEDL